MQLPITVKGDCREGGLQIVALVTSSKKLVVRLWGRLNGRISHAFFTHCNAVQVAGDQSVAVCVSVCGRIRENLLNNRAIYHIQQ